MSGSTTSSSVETSKFSSAPSRPKAPGLSHSGTGTTQDAAKRCGSKDGSTSLSNSHRSVCNDDSPSLMDSGGSNSASGGLGEHVASEGAGPLHGRRELHRGKDAEDGEGTRRSRRENRRRRRTYQKYKRRSTSSDSSCSGGISVHGHGKQSISASSSSFLSARPLPPPRPLAFPSPPSAARETGDGALVHERPHHATAEDHRALSPPRHYLYGSNNSSLARSPPRPLWTAHLSTRVGGNSSSNSTGMHVDGGRRVGGGVEAVVLGSLLGRADDDEYENKKKKEEEDIVFADVNHKRAFLDLKMEELERAYRRLQAQAVRSEDAAVALCHQQEARHREEVEAVRVAWHAEVQSLKETYAKELGEVTAGIEARVASGTAAVVAKYKERLGAFRSKVEEAETAYRMKHVHILGALDESRREVVALKAGFEVRQREYEHQLEERGKAIDAYQRQVAGIRSSRAGAERWRSVALELAASIVELSLTQGDGGISAGMDSVLGLPPSSKKAGRGRHRGGGGYIDDGDASSSAGSEGRDESAPSARVASRSRGISGVGVRARIGAEAGDADGSYDGVWVSRAFLEDMVRNSKRVLKYASRSSEDQEV